MFIQNGEDGQIGVEYKCGMFPRIPNYRKSDSWFLLTDGEMDDIIVDDHTTIKAIRRGQYRRLVEISRSPQVVVHMFNSTCQETSYSFKVTVKANVYVNDPVKFYANIRNINVRDFFNNQFSLDVKEVTQKYSILSYSGIDNELISVLTDIKVIHDTSGLAYQITNVMTEPNDEAKMLLKERDDMTIKYKMTMAAWKIAKGNKKKTYADAIWEEAAKGHLTDVEAIQRIKEYDRKNQQEKLEMLLKLRDEGMISDADISAQTQVFLPVSQSQITPAKQIAGNVTDSVDEFYDDEE